MSAEVGEREEIRGVTESPEDAAARLDQVARFEEECTRLEEMLQSFAEERRMAWWTPAVGLAIAVPACWWRSWAPFLAVVLSWVVMAIWRYLLYGHTNERKFQLEMARRELSRLRSGGSVDAARDRTVPTAAERAFPARKGTKPLHLWRR